MIPFPFLVAIPQSLGFAVAAVVWLLPGIAATRLLQPALTRDPVMRLAVGVLLSTAAGTLAALVSLALRIPADHLHWVLVALAGAAAILLVVPRRGRSPGTASPIPEPALDPGRTVRWLGLATVLLLILVGIRTGASLRFTGDAPDHVGTLREILASGRYFPTEAFHLGIGELGADPRKGLFHPVLAALSHLAGMDPVDFWLRLPALTAMFPFLGAVAFLRWCGLRAPWVLLGGWLTLLSWTGGLGQGDLVGISPFSNQVGATLLWMVAGALIRLQQEPSRPLMAVAGLGTFAAVAVHPMYVVFAAVVYALLGVRGLASRRHRGALRELVGAGVVAAIPTLPYLVYRFLQYAPANPIHTELQGMLLLTSGLFVADPGLLAKHLGALGIPAYLLVLVVFAKRWKRDAAGFFAFWVVVLMLNLTWNPLVVPVLQRTITYLIFRAFWLFPAGLAAGMVLPHLWSGFRSRRRPFAHAAGLALLAVALVPSLFSLASGDWMRRSAWQRDGANDALQWREPLERATAMLPERSSILSDPVTSYLIPAFTTHRVTAPFDQHSSPNDSLAVARILLAREVLSPRVPVSTAWSLTRESGADAVLLNAAFAQPVRTTFWSGSRAVAETRAAMFLESRAFRPLYMEPEFSLWAPVAVLPDSVDARMPVAEAHPAPSTPPLSRPEGLVLFGASVSRPAVAAGDTVSLRLMWGLDRGPVSPGRFVASARLDAVDPPARGRSFDKVRRKLNELQRGAKLRYREDWIPTGGSVPPSAWVSGAAVPDTVVLRPWSNLVPGRYVVSVTLNRLAQMPNHRLRDFFSDEDLYSGVPVDTLTVLPPATP